METKETKVCAQALTLGVALAVSVGGIVFTFSRSKRIKASELEEELLTSSPASDGHDAGVTKLETDDHRLEEGVESECVAEGYCSDPCSVPDTEASKSDRCEIDEQRKQEVAEGYCSDPFPVPETEASRSDICEIDEQRKQEEELLQSVQDENMKLKSKVGDYAKMVMDLEAEIARLKKKLRSNSQQKRDQVLNLQDWKLELRVKELEEMRKVNENLRMENSDLTLKFEKLQKHATSALNNGKVKELERETECLRQEMEKLEEEKYSDLEELVYLRWVNACYRHQLMHQESPGRTPTKELSTLSSPKSPKLSKEPDFDTKSDTSPRAKVLSKVVKIWRGKHNQLQTHKDIRPGVEEGLTLATSRIPSSGVKGSDSLDDGLVVFRSLNSIHPSTESHLCRDPVPEHDDVHDELIKYSQALKISHGR